MKKRLIPILLLVLAPLAYAATTYTTHYNLSKPADGDTDWGSALRDNFDTIDTQMNVNATDISNHIADTVGAHAATAISSTVGAICDTSDTVQEFLTCLDTELNAIVGGSVVTLNGTQTITGAKTFTSLITGTGGATLSGTLTFSDLGSGVLKSSSGVISSATILDADISASAAIARSKINAGTASHVVINDGSGLLSSEATLSKSRGGSGQDNSSLTFPASGTLATVPTSGVVKSNGTVLSSSNVSLTSEVTGTLPIANGGTNLTSLGTANQILGVNSGATSLEYKTISGTTNQVNVSQGAGSVTFSLPQDIATNSNVQFSIAQLDAVRATQASGLELRSQAGTTRITVGGTTDDVVIDGTYRQRGTFRFEDPGVGTNVVNVVAPTLSSSYTLTLPVDDGNSNQVLGTNGSGTLSWVDATSGFTQSTSTSLTASGSITIGTGNADRLQHFVVASSSGAVTLSTSPFGTTDPQDRTLICLVGNSDTNTVTIPVNDAANGMVGNGDVTLGQYDSACFRYISSLDRYVLESRSP